MNRGSKRVLLYNVEVRELLGRNLEKQPRINFLMLLSNIRR